MGRESIVLKRQREAELLLTSPGHSSDYVTADFPSSVKAAVA